MNDQQIADADRVPQVDPDPARGLPARGGGRPELPERSPARRRSRPTSRRSPASSVEDGTYASYGEALFNLDLASGAYSCARCHTQGLELRRPGVPGQGAFGWNLTGGSADGHVPDEEDMIEFVDDRLRATARGTARRAGQRPHARLRQHAHRRAARGHRRVRAEPVMTLATDLLAIDWEPELRGILIVIIAVVTLCGSIYLILGTNLGARLGFLVALTGLVGWMFLMGVIWWIYGIGLKGPEPTWEPCRAHRAAGHRRAVQRRRARRAASRSRRTPRSRSEADARRRAVRRRGLGRRSTSRRPSFGQASSAAGVFLEEDGRLRGRRVPGRQRVRHRRRALPEDRRAFDFLAFWHEPHYVVVEVAPLEPTRDRARPGARRRRSIDETRQRQYVYMVRDLGARRQPAFVLTIGAGADLPRPVLAAAPP